MSIPLSPEDMADRVNGFALRSQMPHAIADLLLAPAAKEYYALKFPSECDYASPDLGSNPGLRVRHTLEYAGYLAIQPAGELQQRGISEDQQASLDRYAKSYDEILAAADQYEPPAQKAA